MNASYQPTPEFEELLGRMCDSELTPVEARRLEEIVARSDDDCTYYLCHVHLHGTLYWNIAQPISRFAFPVAALGEEADLESSIHPSSFILHPSPIPPIVIDPSLTLHSQLFTLHSPVGSFLFSHLMAALILGIGLLAGLAWRISLQPVNDSSSIVDIDRRQELPPVVGRITAMADCRWKQWRVESGEWRANSEIPKSPNPQISVSLGDRFALSSGFMEITYDTGAKVILEAPCTYAVESARSGFLAIGRLTAKVEGQESRVQSQTRIQEHSRLSTPDPRLFAVRTPTAIVTDLGTEFGVEVEESGTTRSHVFQGKIELRENRRGLTAHGASSGDRVIQLTAGESARIERGRNRTVAITREPGRPGRFVRRMPSAIGFANAVAPGSRPSYRLIDLGTLGGATSRSLAINVKGQVAGEAATADGATHAFLYTDGKMKDLGTLRGGNSCAQGINTFGQVVGWSGTNSDEYRAFLHDGDAMKDLGTLGGPSANAYAINDAGVVVGASVNSSGTMRAFRGTHRAGMKDLGALGGPKASSCAVAINAAGLAAGYSRTKDSDLHAVLYGTAGGIKDLGALAGHDSWAYGVNDAGLAAGFFTIDGFQLHVVLYDNVGIKNLKSLRIFVNQGNVALDVNNVGQVVGSVQATTVGAIETHAFLYSEGKMFDLNMLVNPAAGWTQLYATTINDSGQIVGHGRAPDGNIRAFLLTPVRGARGEELEARDRLKTEN